jgi:hypothetical protein
MTFGMYRTLRPIARLLGCVALLAGLVSAAPQSTVSHSDVDTATTRLNMEVRLRKLHLVRPDLIPYPLAYEVYC